MKIKVLFVILVVFCVGIIASAENRKQYQAIEIQQFDVKSGIQFPDDYRTSLQNDLHVQLQKLNTFTVRMSEDSQAALDQRTMRVTGQITEYHPGSKTARALFGMMAGSTSVKAHIQVFDAADGSLLFEDDVDGKVTYWSPNQDSKGATEGLAKEVAKKIKKRFA